MWCIPVFTCTLAAGVSHPGYDLDLPSLKFQLRQCVLRKHTPTITKPATIIIDHQFNGFNGSAIHTKSTHRCIFVANYKRTLTMFLRAFLSFLAISRKKVLYIRPCTYMLTYMSTGSKIDKIICNRIKQTHPSLSTNQEVFCCVSFDYEVSYHSVHPVSWSCRCLPRKFHGSKDTSVGRCFLSAFVVA